MPDNNRVVIRINISGGVPRLEYEHFKNNVSQGKRRDHHVSHNDTIHWRCEAGNCAILFKRDALGIGANPANVLSANAGQDTQPPATVTAPYNGPGADNTYPYFVAVVVTPQYGIPITEDPDIIIDA